MALCLQDKRVTCTATLSDGTDSVSEAASIALENRPPEQPSVSLSPESVTAETESLSCSATGTDPDGQSVSFSYSWTVNAAVQSETAEVLSGPFAKGDVIECFAVPTDSGAS